MVDAFWAEYGRVDPREEAIDRPLAIFYSLAVAVRLPKFPTWARASREFLTNVGLLHSLEEAIDVAETLV